MEETAAEPAFITSNSTIITRADAFAVARSSTSKFLMIGSGFVGFVLGALLSVLLELRDRTFRTSIEIEQHLEPGTVSATPRAIGQTGKSPADLILDDHRSVFAEAFRLSWTNIQLAIAGPEASGLVGGRPNTVIGITSAMTGEGKSTHALAFARTAALSGERVVLIDADLRRAGISRLLDTEPGLTLRDFLCGQSPVSEVLYLEPHSGLYYVPSTPAIRR
jgi:Mrp family chromosome partitioning ATPase